MKKENKTITPNEINKYLYCPYQWYYEKTLGRKHIQQLYRERNEKLELEDTVKANFNKGLSFHNNYVKKSQQRHMVERLFWAMIAVVVLLLVVRLFLG